MSDEIVQELRTTVAVHENRIKTVEDAVKAGANPYHGKYGCKRP